MGAVDPRRSPLQPGNCLGSRATCQPSCRCPPARYCAAWSGGGGWPSTCRPSEKMRFSTTWAARGSVGAHVCLFRAHACLACMQHNIAPEHLDLRSQTIAQQAARTCKYWYTRAAYSPNASSLIPSASSAPSVRGSAASGSKGQSSCAGHGAARQRGRVGGGHSLAVAERSPSGRPAEARNQQGKLPSRAASAPCICPPAGQPRPAARGWAP